MEWFMKTIESFTGQEIAYAVYISVISLSGFIIMGIDKSKARKGEWRVRETVLFVIAFLGGAIGVLMGMLIFKHKTKKKKFRLGIPCIYLLNKVVSLFIIAFLR